MTLLLAEPVDSARSDWRCLALDGRWRLANLLGALSLFGLSGKPLKRAGVALIEVERQVTDAGAALVIGSPTSAKELIGRLRTQVATGQRVQLLSEAFPGLQKLMRTQLGPRERKWLEAELQGFLIENLQGETPITWRPATGSSTLHSKAAARLLHVRPERVRALVQEAAGGPLIRTTRSGRHVLVADELTLEKVRRSMTGWMPISRAADRMGLSAARVKQLIRSGCIRKSGRGVDVASIDHWMATVLGAASQNSVREASAFHDFSEVLRLQVPLPLTEAFFRTLCEGAIALVKRDVGSNLRSMLVDKTAVQAWAKERIDRDLLTIPDAAIRLGLKQEVAYHLVRVGLLSATSRVAARRPAQVIALQEIERFRSEVSPLSALANANGINFRSAKRWAIAQNIAFVSGPGLDGGRQFFVRASWPMAKGERDVD